MFRKTVFWLHLSAGVTAGVFIFIMAVTGVLLAFERQIVDFVDRDIAYVSVPQDLQPGLLNDLLTTVRRADLGQPTAIVVRNNPQAAIQFSLGRGKTVYVDPYSSAARIQECWTLADRNIESTFRRTDLVRCSPLVAAQMELESSPGLNCVSKRADRKSS